MRTFLRVTTTILLCLSILGCSGTDAPKPGTEQSPGLTAQSPSPSDSSTSTESTGGATQPGMSGEAGSKNEQSSNQESNGEGSKGSLDRTSLLSPSFDAGKNAQTEMNIEAGVKPEFQNSPSEAERERVRKKNQARQAARKDALRKSAPTSPIIPVSEVTK